MYSWIFAFLQATSISSIVAFCLATLKLFSIVSWKRIVSCVTYPSFFLKLEVFKERIFNPSTKILPFDTFQKRINNFNNVLFPLPLLPWIPITSFSRIFKFISFKICSSSYAKSTEDTSTILKSVSSLFSTSSTIGDSSKSDMTLCPAPIVCDKVEPKFANAITGPKEDIWRTPDTIIESIELFIYIWIKHKPKDNKTTQKFVKEIVLAWKYFNSFSQFDREEVCLFKPDKRRSVSIYCILSFKPRILSNT